MYFSGTLSIDPSQLTHIEIKQPTKVFGKLLHILTAGQASEKQEIETFTAVSILQGFNMAFRAMGITNIVRLAKDDIDFYRDTKGQKDDLREIMENFRLHTDRYESELFDTLYLVVEHQDEAFKYLIEVDIKRRHKPGEHPIIVKVNSVMRDFGVQSGEDSESVKQKMAGVFASQQSYDTFLQQKQVLHEKFINALEMNIRRAIKVDRIKITSKKNIIRPKQPVDSPQRIPEGDRQNEPVYHGYPGFGEIFLYAWMWSALTHDHHINVSNTSVVDEHGQTMMNVGEQGFDAGASDTLDPEAAFEPPASGDVEFLDGHAFQEEFKQAQLAGSEGMLADGGDSGDWFDSFGDFFDGGGDAGCGSCGGGCGGD